LFVEAAAGFCSFPPLASSDFDKFSFKFGKATNTVSIVFRAGLPGPAAVNEASNKI
jgi:hypothetical protein